nr:hypothetical protein [Tanacetum cinerariifolium]
EAVHEERRDSVERAATTATSLDAKQDNGTINRTQSTVIPIVPFPYGFGSVVDPGAKNPCRTDMFKLGLRGCLNIPMIHLSQELTHLEVGRTS